MQRDAERVDRFTRAIGPDALNALSRHWASIGNGGEIEATIIGEVARTCRDADVSPEAMLVAVRMLSRTLFEQGSLEQHRIDAAWIKAVRCLMDGYFNRDIAVERREM